MDPTPDEPRPSDSRPIDPLSEHSGGAGRGLLPPGLPARERPGCGKGLMIGCGGLLLLIGVLSVVFVLKGEGLVELVMTQFEEELVANFPEGGTDEDRERFQRGFAEAREALNNRDVDPDAMTPVLRKIGEMSERFPDGVTIEDVRELTLALERFAGLEPSEADSLTGADE